MPRSGDRGQGLVGAMSAGDVHVRAPADDLSSLLAVVAGDGWGSAAGNHAIRIMRSACRRETIHWRHKAGWLSDEGLAPVWQQMDRLVRAGRFDDAPGLLRLAARRAYAAEATAMQTGMGSSSTRGLIGAVRRDDVRPVGEFTDEAVTASGEADGERAVPAGGSFDRGVDAVRCVRAGRCPGQPGADAGGPGGGRGAPGPHGSKAGGVMALHSVRGPDARGVAERVDVDAEAGVFRMSPASAEQVTLQIRSMMERAWEYIAIAYQGRAHIALDYSTWDEYVDDRFSDLRLTVPREERGAVVQSLSRAQMSLRATPKSSASMSRRCTGRWARPIPRQQSVPRNQRRFEVLTESSTRAGDAQRRRSARSAATSTTETRTTVRGTCSRRDWGHVPFGRAPDLKVRAMIGRARMSWSRRRRGRRKAWPRIRQGVQWRRFLRRRSPTRSPGRCAWWTSLPRCPVWSMTLRWLVRQPGPGWSTSSAG